MPQYLEAAERVLRSGRYINGPEVSAFEKDLAETTGVGYSIAVSTGLDALRLIFRAYIELGRLKPGDEVIIPANTFIATFLAVTHCGLTAVAADIDPTYSCLDLNKLPITPNTRAIIPVHLYGNICWEHRIMSELSKKGILIIEDNAQAIGARSSTPGLKGSFTTGSLGDAAAISFYPAKNIGAFGDAGAALTDDKLLADKIRELANYGAHEKYQHSSCGFNCRMDELQAALLRLKLTNLKNINDQRRTAAEAYDRLIINPNVIKPTIARDGSLQTWHQYVVRHPRRNALRQYLADNGVGTEIHYPVPCHLQKCYSDNPLLKTYTSLEVSEKLATEILSIPIADISLQEIQIISHLINIHK